MSAPTIRLNERILLEKFDEVRVYYDSERKPTRFGALRALAKRCEKEGK